MEGNPCKGCTERWVSDTDRCHSNCEKYKIAKEKDLAKKKAHRKYLNTLNAIEGLHVHRVKKAHKKFS